MLALQRRGTAVPAPVRRVLRNLVPRARLVSAAAEQWDAPLVVGVGGAGLVDVEGAPVLVPAPSPADLGALSCLVVTDSLDVGGMDAFVDFLARGLRSRGAKVVVLIAADQPERVDGRTAAGLRDDGFQVALADSSTIGAQVRAAEVACVSVHGSPDWVLDAAAACDLPVVETLHGMHTFDDAQRLEARSGHLAAVVAVSEDVKQEYLREVPTYDADRVTVIPNGVPSRRQPAAIRQRARAALGLTDEFVFASLGRYCLQKNTFGLVASFDAVAEAVPGARLVVSGRVDDPSYFAQVAALRDRSPFRDRIHLRDHSTTPSVVLAASDAFVMDSFFEGWSLASTEALTAGVPVVLSDVGGAAEQLAWPDPPGLLVPNPLGGKSGVSWERIAAMRFRPQPNATALAAAMIDVAAERGHWAERREAIAQEAERRFAPQVCLDRHAELLLARSSSVRGTHAV